MKKNKKSTGQNLWNKAKKIIPGGNMLISKRPEMFLPSKWPTYFDRAKGCTIWDLDGNKLIDMSAMGVGTNILGYGNKEVDKEVRNVISKGNLSTLNCPEEVYLAEKLIEIHPWAEMVKFSRTGGEANAIAVRIARAASGREKIAFCGYHGWHDWYLSANLGEGDALGDGHLLPGLNPLGVPRGLKGTAIPFGYNNTNEFLNAFNENKDEIAGIIVETVRNMYPNPQFFQTIKQFYLKGSSLKGKKDNLSLFLAFSNFQ